MKNSEGRKPRNRYVCEREVVLQLDNQLNWRQIISQQCKTKRNAVEERSGKEEKSYLFSFIIQMYINYVWQCVTRLFVKLIKKILFTRINWKRSLSQIYCTVEQMSLSWTNTKGGSLSQTNIPESICIYQWIEQTLQSLNLWLGCRFDW